MRQIKFRAWDLDNFEMFTYDQIGDVIFGLENDGSVSLFICDSGETPKVEIMQFTGLKDKNGVDIYESDILSIGKDLDAFNCVVGFDEHQGSFRCRNVNESEYYSEHLYGADTCEVIGNIHQNHELLNG